MASLGVTLCAAAGGYWASLPNVPLVVRIDGSMLFFSLGWCFWLVLIAGIMSKIIISKIIIKVNFAPSSKVHWFLLYKIKKSISKLVNKWRRRKLISLTTSLLSLSN